MGALPRRQEQLCPAQKSAPPASTVNEEGDGDEHKPRLTPLPPVEPCLGMCTPGMPAELGPVSPSPPLRPVSEPRSLTSSDETTRRPAGTVRVPPRRAGTPATSRRTSSTVLPSFASIAPNSESDVKAKAQVEEQMKRIVVIQAWLDKHGQDEDQVGERREEMRMRDVEMVA